VLRLCWVLGTSRSGYYKHLATEDARAEHAAEEAATVVEIRASHAEHRSAYGAPRVHAELRSRGHRINRTRVTEADADPPRRRPAPAPQQTHDDRGQVGSTRSGSGDAGLHRYSDEYEVVWGRSPKHFVQGGTPTYRSDGDVD
jgi:hypothetical protein